jgi:uncharacterized protein (DUF1810 family)
MTTDRFNLQRFVAAQQSVYSTVLAELKSGRKQTHWIWFIFPQVDGLGRGSTAQHFAIRSRDEPLPIWRRLFWVRACSNAPN